MIMHNAEGAPRASVSIPLVQLLDELQRLGVKLWIDGEKLAYSAPKGALTAAHVSALRAHKEEVLASLRAANAKSSAYPPLLKRNASASHEAPLSFAQQSLWIVELLGRGAAYNLPAAFRIRGPLNLPVLQRSLEEIALRHESLRTVIAEAGGRAWQIVESPRPIPISLHDLQSVAAAVQEEAIRNIASDTATKPFDLKMDHPLRVAIAQLAPEEHILFVTLHHIAVDGWSIGVFFRELSVLYQAFSQGMPSPLPPLPVQYADYAIWQRSWSGGKKWAQDVAFWKKHLDGAPPLLGLPTDRPRSSTQSHRGGSSRFRLDSSLVEHLRAFARREGGTLFSTVFAAFNVLLARHCQDEDIVVGVPIAGRVVPALESLIGFFNNSLAVRTNLAGNPTFVELHSHVRKVLEDAYEHQDLPFAEVVNALGVERSLSYSPLYQATLVLQNSPPLDFSLAGTSVLPEPCESPTTRFDLVVDLTEHNGAITGICTYNADLFDPSTIERWMEHFQVMLADIAKDPTKRVQQMQVLGENERRRLLSEWNDTRAPIDERPVHELFAEMARKVPDAVAASMVGGKSVTYCELDEQSNRIAHELRSLGVRPEVLVGVYMDRSLELVASLLGILKAGGAYLPLDVAHPVERTAFMLADSEVRIVLTQEHLRSRFPQEGVKNIAIDTQWARISELSAQPLSSDVRLDNLAYVIYTSGSTGRPKGVMIEHRGLTNYLQFAARAYDAKKGSGALVFSSLSFDLTVTSLFAPLIAGSSLRLLGQENEIEALAAELQDDGDFSFVKLTPAHLSLLGKLLPAESAARAARKFVIGGEALQWEALSALRGEYTAAHVVNEYGPTETVVGCCVYEARADEPKTGPMPIGRPLPNTRLYILDKHMSPVPIGVVGELYIGGIQVGRGYLNRPELDAERFLPDPFAPPGENGKLYRTGDLARYRADGNLEFLGRADNQIKLNGFRIELGEIESAMREFSGVHEAAAVLRADPQKRIVGYVSPNEGAKLEIEVLRAHLVARLPEYMIPAEIVCLDKLPLTSNGKIDRAALPAPSRKAEALGVGEETPLSPTEEILTSIFREILGLSSVGRHQRFFSLGGDSMSSVEVVVRARRHGLGLTLQQVFQYQTIYALARVATEAAGAQATSAPFELVRADDRSRLPENIEDAYPPAAVQLAMLFFSGLDSNAHVYQTVSSHRVCVRFDPGVWEKAIQSVVARHPVMRASFDLASYSEPLLLVHRIVDVPVQVHDLRSLPDAEQRRVFLEWQAEEQRKTIAWTQSPLFRVHVHRIADAECQFTLSLHHALLDGWSLAVVVTEILERYATLLRNVEAKAPPALTNTFRDFIQRERAATLNSASLQFWAETLREAAPSILPRWPTSQRKDKGPGFCNVALPASFTASLTKVANAAAVPTKSVLLAAHILVLGRVMNQSSVIVGFAGHGRPETEDADRIIGNFLNVLPLRIDDVRRGTFIDLCRAAFDAEQKMLPHRGFPLAEIQKRAGGQRLFESTVNYVHFRAARRLQGIDELDVGEAEGIAPGEMTLQANFSVDPRSGDVRFQLTYDPQDLCHAQVEAIAEYHVRVFTAMFEKPAGPCDEIDLLTDEERRKVLVEWNGGEFVAHTYPLVHERIFAQAARTPEAIAVRGMDDSTETLTYGALADRAHQLAHHLRSLSIGPGAIVGIHVERSVEMVITLLGVLETGAAYVPLEPHLPKARLEAIIGVAKPDLVIHEKTAPDLAGITHFLALDAEARVIAGRPTTNLGVSVLPENLAYILFTSGTTGIPKGVEMPHASFAAFIDGACDGYGIRSSDRVLQFSTLGFDTAIEEIYITLAQGGMVVLRDDLMVSSTERFLDGCHRLGITALNLPTAYWHMLVDDIVRWNLQVPSCLRLIMVGGEEASKQRVHAWLKHVGDAIDLVNIYGPTECSPVSTTCKHSQWADRWEEKEPFPIGRPLPTARAYILDERLSPLPVGTPGELYLGGPQVSRGYAKQPELTSNRFLSNPFAPGRLYRTGDLARWLPTGDLEFRERADDQIKIRGFRVEPAEIESALSGHPDVHAAAVLGRESKPGEKSLVAYAVLRRASPAVGDTPARTLRKYLQQKLPEYSVPAEIMIIDEMPLNNSGKIDRAALLRLREVKGVEAVEFTGKDHAAPKNATEETLVAIFAEVLGISPVGVEDDFFELGGSSLAAMQISSRIQRIMQIHLPFRPILERPTISRLAEYVSDRMLAERLQGADVGMGTEEIVL